MPVLVVGWGGALGAGRGYRGHHGALGVVWVGTLRLAGDVGAAGGVKVPAGGVGGVRGIRVVGVLEAQPHWAQVQVPSTPTDRGVRVSRGGGAGRGESEGHWRVTGGMEAQPHWAPVQDPSTPTGKGCRDVREHWGGKGVRGIRGPAGV